MNTSMQTLTDKLKEKMTEDRLAVERLTQEQLNLLTKNLEKQFADVNASINTNMAELNRRVRLYQLKPWVIFLIVGLLLSPCLMLGTLWVDRYLDSTIRQKLTTLEKHNQALQALDAAGIEHQTSKDSLYLITPNKKQPEVYLNKNYPDRWIIKIED